MAGAEERARRSNGTSPHDAITGALNIRKRVNVQKNPTGAIRVGRIRKKVRTADADPSISSRRSGHDFARRLHAPKGTSARQTVTASPKVELNGSYFCQNQIERVQGAQTPLVVLENGAVKRR